MKQIVKRFLYILLALVYVFRFEPDSAVADDALTVEDQRALNTAVHGIEYRASEFNVYPGKGGKEYYIDLWNECIVEDENAPIKASYFFNGFRWIPVAFTQDEDNSYTFDITKNLNKGGAYMLCSEYDAVEKTPTAESAVWVFPSISKRATIARPKLDYWKYSDRSGKSNGKWTIDDKMSDYNIALLQSDKKTVDSAGWGYFPLNDGLNVMGLSEDGKQTTTFFSIRTKPVITRGEIRPASKPLKLSVRGIRKAPFCKVDYKQELIRLQKNVIIGLGEQIIGLEEPFEITYEWKAAADTRLTKNGLPIALFTDSDGKSLKIVAKEAYAFPGARLSEEESYFGQTLLARFPVIEDKPRIPASAFQVINITARPMIDTEIFLSDVIQVSGGKTSDGRNTHKEKFNSKVYEVLGDSGWGGLRDSASSVYIRTKNTARFNRSGETIGEPASLPMLCFVNGYGSGSGGTYLSEFLPLDPLTGDPIYRHKISVKESPSYQGIPKARFGDGTFPNKPKGIVCKPDEFAVMETATMEFSFSNLTRTQADGSLIYESLYAPGNTGDIMVVASVEEEHIQFCNFDYIVVNNGDTASVTVTMTYTGIVPNRVSVKLRLLRGTEEVEEFYSPEYLIDHSE